MKLARSRQGPNSSVKLLLSKTTDFRPAITGIITQIAFKRFCGRV